MRKLLGLVFIGSAFLAGCGPSISDEERIAFYKEVMLNGEVLTSEYGGEGTFYAGTRAQVKYKGKLYLCRSGWEMQCVQL